MARKWYGWQRNSHLDLTGKVPGITEEMFLEPADAAKAG